MSEQLRSVPKRRFIVDDPAVVLGATSEHIIQAYIFDQQGFAVAVRLTRSESYSTEESFATLSGQGPQLGLEREEYEMSVSPTWAAEVIARSASLLLRRRYQLVTDQTWEIDEFLGENAGLWIAELVGGSDLHGSGRPTWLGREVRNEPSLENEWLSRHPLSHWSHEERAAVGLAL